MGDLTALYLTDNCVEPRLDKRIKELLLEALGDTPLVSVSQKPIDFGDNICVGEIGRNACSLYYQMQEGLRQIKTKFVAITEHDCIYSSEHFNWRPPDDKYFWYNINCYLAQLENPKFPQYDGMFSMFSGRRVQSQLICSTSLLLEAIEKRTEIACDPAWLVEYPMGRLGEPGTNELKRSMYLVRKKQ